MVDNIELIKPLLEFTSKDEFYMIEIIRRKKENPELGSNSRVVQTYYITSVKYLEQHYSEMKAIAEALNARVNIYLDKKSFTKAYSLHLVKMGDLLLSKDMNVVNRMYKKAAVKARIDNNTKSWIVDVDDCPDINGLTPIVDALHDIRPVGNKVITVLPSKSGFHIITKRFDVVSFGKLELNLDIHKNNPTNLYIPN